MTNLRFPLNAYLNLAFDEFPIKPKFLIRGKPQLKLRAQLVVHLWLNLHRPFKAPLNFAHLACASHEPPGSLGNCVTRSAGDETPTATELCIVLSHRE